MQVVRWLFVSSLAHGATVRATTCGPMPNGCPTRYNSGDDVCECSGPAIISLSVCGRSGTAYCDNECFIDPSTVTAAHQFDGGWHPEDCNNCDDDYDGYKDNPVRGQSGGVLSRSCTTGAPPGSGCVGVQTCGASHTWGTCVYCGGRNNPDGSPMTCQAEVCDGLDDNCNSATDEGNVCRVNRCLCQPTTCAQQGVTCGTISDGCGGTLSCGTCATGQTCLDTGVCCARAMCPTGWCGSRSDGCGGTLTCGCQGSQVCPGNGTCCQPITCAAAGAECGSISDGCGGTLSCGSCQPWHVCNNNICTPCDPEQPGGCAPESSSWDECGGCPIGHVCTNGSCKGGGQ